MDLRSEQMHIARPGDIWRTGEHYDLTPSISDIVQLYVKIPGCDGYNAVWCRVTDITSGGLAGRVVDGPGELKGQHISFNRGNVFHVI